MVAAGWRLLCATIGIAVHCTSLAVQPCGSFACMLRASAFTTHSPRIGQAYMHMRQNRCLSSATFPHHRLQMRSMNTEPMDKAKQVDRAKQVLEGVYRGQDFWVWTKNARERSGSSTRDARFIDTGDLTYGEFDLDFFQKLLELAEPRPGDVICDLGSGSGRLVIYAALLFGGLGNEYRGVEIMEGLHEAAVGALAKSAEIVNEEEGAWLSRVKLQQCDVYEDPSSLHGVDVCFCYSTAWSAWGSELRQLSCTLGENMRVGSRIITTDKILVSDGPWEYELLHTVQGKNAEVGGSTGYVWRVVKSPMS